MGRPGARMKKETRKRKNARKRKNPAADLIGDPVQAWAERAEIRSLMASAVGSVVISESLDRCGATLAEASIIAAVVPGLIRVLRGGGDSRTLGKLITETAAVLESNGVH